MSTSKDTYKRRWQHLIAVAERVKENQELQRASKPLRMIIILDKRNPGITKENRRTTATKEYTRIQADIFGVLFLYKKMKSFRKFKSLWTRESLTYWKLTNRFENHLFLLAKFFGLSTMKTMALTEMEDATELLEYLTTLGSSKGYL